MAKDFGVCVDLPWPGNISRDNTLKFEDGKLVFRCKACNNEAVLTGDECTTAEIIKHCEIWHYSPKHPVSANKAETEVFSETIERIVENIEELYEKLSSISPVNEKATIDKMHEELREFSENPCLEEAADLLLLLLGWLVVSGVDYEELISYAEIKSEKNLKRRWGLSATGSHQHV